MSLHRVSSLETFQFIPTDQRSRRGSGSEASIRARKLSFNPLPESWNPSHSKGDTVQAVGAFDVPRWKRILQIAVTVFYCLFAAGVVFGYAAIKPVLKQEGAYQDMCDGDNTCVEIHLNLMFTLAAVATNVAALPIGAILDYYGPRVCGILGAFFLAAGSVTLAYAQDMPFDGFLVGYLLLALGGPFTYISSFQLSNAFPRHSGLILALLTGAFDASSAVFLIYRVIFEKTEGSFGHKRFFLVYLVVPAAILVIQLTIMPKQSYKTVGEMIEDIEGPSTFAIADEADDQVDEETALLRAEHIAEINAHEAIVAAEIDELLGDTKADAQAQREEAKNIKSGVWGIMHTNSALEQIRSPWFILICLFTVVQMTRINYFVATIRAQYQAILGQEAAVGLNNFFDLALPLGGIISIPFIGTILDHTGTVTVLTTLVTVATSIGLLGVLPFTWAAYGNVILFVLYRPFYYTAVSDYSAKVFGFRTFGTVYGTIICLSGLFNFSQSALDYSFQETFRGDPIPNNLILMCLGIIIGVALVGYVWWQVRKLNRKREQVDDIITNFVDH